MTAEEFDEKFDDHARIVELARQQLRDAQGAVRVAQSAIGDAQRKLREAEEQFNKFIDERAAGVRERDAQS